MFPSTLDNAKVLYYTPPGNYGVIRLDTGEIDDYISYLAICRYPNDSKYYLFGCNAEYEVISDWLWETLQEAMGAAQPTDQKELIWLKA